MQDFSNCRRGALLLGAALLAATSVMAQSYTYRNESFEGAEWATKGASVTSATGQWTTNNNVSDKSVAHDGAASLYMAKKAGITLPVLNEGAGSLIYWVKAQNRTVNVEISTDNATWTPVESYKDKANAWTKHTVTINNPEVRYIRISTTSNSQAYFDDILVTKLDGTDGDGNVVVSNINLPYFVHDFEDNTTYPGDKTSASTESAFTVTGQGEWKYLNAYRGTNEQYIPDGSGASLRMLKSGSYIISPVLTDGVNKVIFDEGRAKGELKLYTSTDGGATWTLASTVTCSNHNEVTVGEKTVNRVKLANEDTSDADIDNFTVTGFPSGTPATVSTGNATDITSSTAVVTGTITDKGDRNLVEQGVCWSITGDPTVSRNAVKAPLDNFTVTLTGLPASSTVNYRAYAITMAGVAYGETRSLTTAAPTVPVVTTGEVKIDDVRTDEVSIYVCATGTVVSDGGVAVSEAGIVYSTSPNPTIADSKEKASLLPGGNYVVYIPLQPDTKYYFRAYATNSVGTAYGDEVSYTTGAIVVPEYPHNAYYCDPSGDDATADGSEAKPFYSLQKAVDKVVPGDVIYMNAGTYKYNTRINISTIGEKGSGMIRLESRGGRAVLDFSAMAVADANQGIRMCSSYWHVYGLDIVGAGDNGMLIERNKPTGGSYADIAANVDQAHDNIIENCNFIRNADTGLQLKNLAANNKIINCDAYYNTDPGHGNADGFAVKLSHGDGNYFYGCRAWQNSDDGWDQFIKKDGGFPDDITTTLEYCWAFKNGYLENGTKGSGNGNGFKMGSNQGRNNVILNRCMAFENLNKSFDQNHNTGNMILNNCSGYATKDTSGKSRYTYRLDEAVASGHEIRLTNCVAISDGISDRNKSAYAPHSVTGKLVTCDLNTLPADYRSVNVDEALAARNADGTLPVIDFLRPTEGNKKFIDLGTPVSPYAGESRWSEGIKYNGSAPDLGYYESENAQSGIGTITSVTASSRLSLVQAHCGLVIIQVDNVLSTDELTLNVYDMEGRVVATRQFNGSTTSINLPAVNGILIINVTGRDLNESVKVTL